MVFSRKLSLCLEHRKWRWGAACSERDDFASILIANFLSAHQTSVRVISVENSRAYVGRNAGCEPRLPWPLDDEW